MGGLISKNKKYSFEDLLTIQRQSVLNYWIKEDEITIQMIDDFIKAVFHKEVSENFPTLEIDLLKFLDEDLTDIDNLKKYKSILEENVKQMKCMIEVDENIRQMDTNLFVFK